MAPDVKYPEIEVELSDHDGNAFAIMGRCQGALRRAGVDKAEIDAFLAECMDGDYDHLLRTCMGWMSIS